MSSEEKYFTDFSQTWPKGVFAKPVMGERGNHDLPSGTEGGEKMDLDLHYEHKQHTFDRFCKTTIKHEAYVCNRYASGGKNACSSHYINQKVLTQIVMTDIRCKAMWAQNSRETLRTQLLAREQATSAERTRTLQAELNALGKRLPELDKLIQSAYEDKVLGRIPESVCVNLLNQYEAERREKQERRKELTEQLAASRETESSVDTWLDMMQDYAQLEELDRPTLVRLIQKIEISERYPVDDHEERDIHIYYNFVGYIEA